MTTATITDSTALHFHQGSSDEEYHSRVEPEGGGYVVRFRFGRRGSALQTGVKTLTPVDCQTAGRFYEKLVRERVPNGILSQLLNPISEDHAACLIDDPDWGAQEKFDGMRTLIRKAGVRVTGSNRKGLAVALPQPIADTPIRPQMK